MRTARRSRPRVVRFSPSAPWIQREALFLQLVDAFGGDQQDGLARSAMNLRMRVPVAGDAERSDNSVRDRALGHAARRNVDLENGRGGHLYLSYRHRQATRSPAPCV